MTAAQANAWWQVDLGQVHEIPAIRIHGRTDCCTERLGDFSVFVSDAPFTSDAIAQTRAQPGVTEYTITTNTLTTVDIDVGRTGRHVRVQLHGADHLQLAEVLVVDPTSRSIPTWSRRGVRAAWRCR
jgi:alpha-L-fucosidase